MCNNNMGEEDIGQRRDYVKAKKEYRMLLEEKKKKEGERKVEK